MKTIFKKIIEASEMDLEMNGTESVHTRCTPITYRLMKRKLSTHARGLQIIF